MTDGALITIPMVVALVAAVRQAVDLPTRLLPLWSITLGVLLSLLASGFSNTSALEGVIVGLSASGLYSGGKALVRG